MKKLSIIIPCFNENESISYLCDSVFDVLADINMEYELLFIDDGSTDNTLDIIKKFNQTSKNISYISFSRNFGKEKAMYAGLKNVEADYIAIMDADMQDPPELIPKMLEILETTDYELCRTYRNSREGEPVVRSWFAHRFYKIISKFSPTKIHDGTRDFCLMKQKVAEAILKIKERNRFSKEILSWLGFKTYWLSFENAKRCAGKSKWNFIKLVLYAIDCFYNIPQLFTYLFYSMLITLNIALIIALILLLKQMFYGNGSYSTLMAFVCAAIFVVVLSVLYNIILSMYLRKTYVEIKQRPLYIIKEASKESFI